MSNGPKKISELSAASSYANTDLFILVGNTTTNATSFSLTPAVLFANVVATTVHAGNTVNVGANNVANATSLRLSSNTTVNTIITATSITQSNTTATPFTANVTGLFHTGTVNATSHTVGANFIANSTATTIASNTLTLGTSLATSANGYSYLPNNLKLNWGSFVCNTTSVVTFSNAFSTALLSVAVTPANAIYIAANVPYVTASNTTTATIISASTTSTSNCFYMAIGY